MVRKFGLITFMCRKLERCRETIGVNDCFHGTKQISMHRIGMLRSVHVFSIKTPFLTMTCTENLLNLRRQDVQDWQGTHVMPFIFLIEDTTFSVVWFHTPFWHVGDVNKYFLLSLFHYYF